MQDTEFKRTTNLVAELARMLRKAIVAIIVTSMKIAIPACRNRIAPLFDVAETVVLFDAPEAQGTSTQTVTIDTAHDDVSQLLLDAGVKTVLCGAISRCWQNRLWITLWAHFPATAHSSLATTMSR